MKLERTEQFARDFASLPESTRRRAEKQLRLFVVNPRHPSIGTHDILKTPLGAILLK